RDGAVYLRKEDGAVEKLIDRSELKLRGNHNVENFMAAVLAAMDYCTPAMIRKVAHEFGGVRHRMEFIRSVNGVQFYNDSIGSSPTRTIATLRSFDQKVRLIAGGYDKKIPYTVLGPVVADYVEKLYLCGATAEKIRDAVLACDKEFAYEIYPNLKAATEAAYAESKDGDIVLLSPASASFDQFKNFEERGDYFASVVEDLR
ncbi:MAG: UDP-N-acetylmuramoyl-L-alanine--D-glutamate ligase, partial [Clostridia bacterium]|nr:UDP-N-acetylmuramoyl-L-alanine--D-glutamate ligase [Clostridia bacterium]